MLDENDWLVEADELDVDFNNLRRKHVKSGYREGVTAGQEYSLQSSFNAGFMKSSSHHEKLATYRGCLSAIMMFLSMNEQCPHDIVEKVEEAILMLEKVEDNEVHVDTMLEDRKIFLHLNSKLSNLDCIEKNEQEPVEVGVLDELSDAMNHSFKTVTENVEAMDEIDVENGRCSSECAEKCLSNGNGKKSLRCNNNSANNISVEASSCRRENIPIEKTEKLFNESVVAMKEIVLDTLNHTEGYFKPTVLRKIRNILIE